MFDSLPSSLKHLKLACCHSYSPTDVARSLYKITRLETLQITGPWRHDVDEEEGWESLTTQCEDRNIVIGIIPESMFW
jgi:hypothetical protein